MSRSKISILIPKIRTVKNQKSILIPKIRTVKNQQSPGSTTKNHRHNSNNKLFTISTLAHVARCKQSARPLPHSNSNLSVCHLNLQKVMGLQESSTEHEVSISIRFQIIFTLTNLTSHNFSTLSNTTPSSRSRRFHLSHPRLLRRRLCQDGG